MSSSVQRSVQRVENTGEPIYGNAELEEVEDTPQPVAVNQFSEYVTLLKRDNNAGFEKQYKVCNLCYNETLINCQVMGQNYLSDN